MTADMLVFAHDRPAVPDRDSARLLVGPGCRIGTHNTCPQRREPSVVDT
jgi:predicted transcriptional regulator